MESIGQAAWVALLGLALAVVTVAWLLKAAVQPGLIERLERSMVSNQSRLDTQEGEIDDLRRQIHELRESRLADHALLQEWISYARRLAEMFREATGREPPPEPNGQPRPLGPVSLAALARKIEAAFSLEEINTLGFELGLDGKLTGETTEARAASLVLAAMRRGQTSRLMELCREQRPEGGF